MSAAGKSPGRIRPPRFLALFLMLLANCGGEPASAPAARRVTNDLLADQTSWRVISSSTAGQVGQETTVATVATVAPTVITPDLEYATDSGDRPALLMSPPCEVELTIPAVADGAKLVLFAGVDLSVARRLGRDAAKRQREGGQMAVPYLDIIFEVEKNGLPVFGDTLRTHPKRARDGARAG
ncbi:MAG: hypothetical protein QF615_14205, partial [Planctomycetota bacterium]|nr:hypothetical protein [Planctomycetota bacterium]